MCSNDGWHEESTLSIDEERDTDVRRPERSDESTVCSTLDDAVVGETGAPRPALASFFGDDAGCGGLVHFVFDGGCDDAFEKLRCRDEVGTSMSVVWTMGKHIHRAHLRRVQ